MSDIFLVHELFRKKMFIVNFGFYDGSNTDVS